MSAFAVMAGFTAGTGGNVELLDMHEPEIKEEPMNKTEGVEIAGMNTTLKVNITYDEWAEMNVTFYDGDHNQIGDQQNYTTDEANVTWENLEYGTEYMWYVNVTEADNEEENYTESEMWTFTTEHNPQMPELVSPGNGNVVSIYPGMNTTLEVNVTHPEGKDMNVTFYGNMSGENLEILDQKTSIASGNYANFTWEGLAYGTEYMWHVNVTESGNEQNYTMSDTWTFTTEEVITDVMPANGAGDVALGDNMDTMLEVNVSHPMGDDMNVTFYGNMSGENLEWLHNETVADGEWANYNWDGLDYDTEYTWYVEIANATTGEVITESSTWTFSTQEENFSLTIDSTEGGEVVDPGEGTFNYGNGTEINLEAVANEGYRFVEWTVDTGTIDDTTANATTIEMLDDYEITAEFAEEEYFKVEIIDYSEDVTPGDYLMIEFNIENTGGIEGTQNITLSVDGSVEDTKELTVEAGENKTDELFWTAEAGSYLITVASENDEDTAAVNGIEAESALPGIPGFTSFLLVLATIFAVVIYNKKKR